MVTYTDSRARVTTIKLLLAHVMQVPEGWVAAAYGLPGCATQGETREEAHYMLKDAYEGVMAMYESEGEDPPFDPTYDPWEGRGQLEWVSLQ